MFYFISHLIICYVAYRTGVWNERNNPGDIDEGHLLSWTRYEWASQLGMVCLAGMAWAVTLFAIGEAVGS